MFIRQVPLRRAQLLLLLLLLLQGSFLISN